MNITSSQPRGKKGVLHCDISWANVLINHNHFEGHDEGDQGFHFIDNILKKTVSYISFFLSIISHNFVGCRECKFYSRTSTMP